MAEVVGTIAVFKACIHAFDLFQTAQSANLDMMRLLVCLNIERCRLYTRGGAMGFTNARRPGARYDLDKALFEKSVKDILDAMRHLFQDTEKLQTRYGCKEVKESPIRRMATDWNAIDHLAASFSRFYVPEAINSNEKAQ
ncbi:hypothetical protein EJ04DRAFT_597274 [Polyplosphaeria fusca]|uniref:Prion-inhibition and propagation HeLo domain-containing protein n=1 Tax=Polyplosphaeria fusca TaxID=682080 RepID=A0A9P4R462_9PLEO|nr:hypothetical protein EJ04DRAFT_597274 [Polyplosphaeria fusca]